MIHLNFSASDSFLSDTVDNTFSQKELDDFVFSKYGIISFTETKDNLLMWSHYGDNHKGFVVEFNYNHNYFRSMFNNSSNDIEGNIYRVLYRKERFHGKSTEEDSAFLELFFHKSDEWEYEKEHRLLISFKHTNSAQELNLELRF
ncbi:DUF2971 domain-containing protein [Photobacterium leiognathi]|uniref:DUF2971 domain-containing protein n=1 Tax=Photobacterium leiognathi TaxID=553611 RepID=UPI002738C671|nr:DUF2971 domain-containing protein [Photobacterium leiognathi]